MRNDCKMPRSFSCPSKLLRTSVGSQKKQLSTEDRSDLVYMVICVDCEKNWLIQPKV